MNELAFTLDWSLPLSKLSIPFPIFYLSFAHLSQSLSKSPVIAYPSQSPSKLTTIAHPSLHNVNQREHKSIASKREIKWKSHLRRWQRIRWAWIFFLLLFQYRFFLLIWGLGFSRGAFCSASQLFFASFLYWFAFFPIYPLQIRVSNWYLGFKRGVPAKTLLMCSVSDWSLWCLDLEQVIWACAFFFVFVLIPIWEFFLKF